MKQGRTARFPVMRRSFPGLIAPASLKRPPSRNRPRHPAGFSGVNRPGLIEAYSRTFPTFSGRRFSGVNRPGLIEAARSASRIPPSRPGFPGLIAPASLKHFVAVGNNRDWRAFSGVNRPGLIEARHSNSTATGCCPSFPGLIAPASLKRAAVGGPKGFRPVFRG